MQTVTNTYKRNSFSQNKSKVHLTNITTVHSIVLDLTNNIIDVKRGSVHSIVLPIGKAKKSGWKI